MKFQIDFYVKLGLLRQIIIITNLFGGRKKTECQNIIHFYNNSLVFNEPYRASPIWKDLSFPYEFAYFNNFT